MYRKLTTICAVAALALGLAACGGGGGDGNGNGDTGMQMPEPMPDPAIAEREAIGTAIMAAQTAVNAVDNDSTDADVSAADMAVANARTAIANAANVPADERAANTGTVNALATQLAGAKTARQTAMDQAEDAAQRAMRLAASRLTGGIGTAPLNPAANNDTTAAATDGQRTAQYTGTNDADITVRYDSNPVTGEITDSGAIELTEDKTAVVHDNHGWSGKRYTRTVPTAEGTYEAIVYSNVEAPEEGRMFGSSEPGTGDNRLFEYTLANGVFDVPDAGGGTQVPARVAFTGVTRTAGIETFRLPSPNPSGADIITGISGTYHGVSGTYSCEPTTPADGCSATVDARGFNLAGGAWTFRPGNPNARVMGAADTAYSSYGWWLHTSADGRTLTASAFTDAKSIGTGTVTPASGLDTLNGTATYVGGAAGKYSLFSLTGGTNDAGHFTARATLEADFTNNTETTAISGTIDQFIGADGEMRNWSVALMPSAIADTGGIGDMTSGTRWTIDDITARSSGQWSGSLGEQGTDGVPEVATGTFHSWYANTGRMVGAFGANKQ